MTIPAAFPRRICFFLWRGELNNQRVLVGAITQHSAKPARTGGLTPRRFACFLRSGLESERLCDAGKIVFPFSVKHAIRRKEKTFLPALLDK